MTLHPDLLLVRDALRGNDDSRVELVFRLRAVPKAIASGDARFGRRLGRSDLEDLAQEIVSLVWERLGEYAGDGPFDGWVRGFCALGLLGYRRKLRRVPARLPDPLRLAAAATPESDVLERDGVRERLDALDAAAREVVRLKHFEDRTFEEIAILLGIPSATAKTRYYRALARLRVSLAAFGSRKASFPPARRPRGKTVQAPGASGKERRLASARCRT